MSVWYCLGGSWRDIGPPRRVALDRKPQGVFETKPAAVILGMEIVTKRDNERSRPLEEK